jgi:hypothetical protein
MGVDLEPASFVLPQSMLRFHLRCTVFFGFCQTFLMPQNDHHDFMKISGKRKPNQCQGMQSRGTDQHAAVKRRFSACCSVRVVIFKRVSKIEAKILCALPGSSNDGR